MGFSPHVLCPAPQWGLIWDPTWSPLTQLPGGNQQHERSAVCSFFLFQTIRWKRRVIFENEQSIGCIVVANQAGCQPEAPPPGPVDADGADSSTGRSPEAGASGIRSRSGSKPQAIASLVAKLDTEQPGLSFTTLRSVRLQKIFAGHQALCLFAHLR